ncbi:MAG: phosphoribosylanthranilate isomerase [Planctomycetes bacterium]|nr:phosphoribosylanthranilate isomerase [Planctomycetota bacterium]
MRVRVKICGIARPEWAAAAAEAGADAIGLVFAESPRRVTPAEAAAIVRALPPWVAPVGVFVDEPPGRIVRLAGEVGLAAAQLHGDEPPDALAAMGDLKVIKAFRIGSEADVAAAAEWKRESERLGRVADAYLVDARLGAGGPKGGSGYLADWRLAARMVLDGFRPLILAGGLGPENVAEAVAAVRPWGVDGSSGLETAPGRKSPERIREFVQAVRRCTG